MAHIITLEHTPKGEHVVKYNGIVYDSTSEITIANNEQMSITSIGASWEIYVNPTSSLDLNYTISEGHTISFPISGKSKDEIIIEATCQSCSRQPIEARKKIILVRVKMMAEHNIPQV